MMCIFGSGEVVESADTSADGGKYGPGFLSFFEEQNEKIANGTWDVEGEQYVLHLDTLILINSCMDRRVEYPYLAEMAFNNTYGIQALNETIYDGMKEAYSQAGGCRDQIDSCRAVGDVYDPHHLGINATVNKICADAETFCMNNVGGSVFGQYSGRKNYDLTQIYPNPFPYQFFIGWLNRPVSTRFSITSLSELACSNREVHQSETDKA